MTAAIDTTGFSEVMRARGVDRAARTLRITDLRGSDQEHDLQDPPNAGGFGRIRHFRQATSAGWPDNPLPIVPAARALGLALPEALEAQVFQNAVCNWRCWYCYVDFELLSGRQDRSAMLSADQLVERYSDQPDRPLVIDLSGGQPDLVPEWVPWMMDALTQHGLYDTVYLWSDDNLSTDYYWRFLSDAERLTVSAYRNYGKVCCFKGFDRDSFAFNTGARPELFDQQFRLFGRLLAETSIDLFAYVTLTCRAGQDVEHGVGRFMDRLQELDRNLPLRTVPLEVQSFGPVMARGLSSDQRSALERQEEAVGCWNEEMALRFSASDREQLVSDVRLGNR